MKKFIVILTAIFFCVTAKSQEYFVHFNATGANSTVDSVQVINLTHPDTITVGGNDVLHLISWPVGVKENTQVLDNGILIYPSPMRDVSTIKFNSPSTGNVAVSVTDMAGKNIYTGNFYVLYGENFFKISGVNRGLYLVSVIGKDYRYCEKLVVDYDVPMSIHVGYTSNIPKKVNLKDAKSGNFIEMEYIPGDRFQYTGKSDMNKSLVIAKTSDGTSSVDTTLNFRFFVCIDAKGKSYTTVQILVGGKKSPLDSTVQTWMAQSLNLGNMINGNTFPANDTTIEKWCYDNDTNNCNVYGGLYSWDEMMKYSDTSTVGICPQGWRLPNMQEWQNLIDYYGGEQQAMVDMIETGNAHWGGGSGSDSCYVNATNLTGFSARGAGQNDFGNGGFLSLKRVNIFWTRTYISSNVAIMWHFDCQNSATGWLGYGRQAGFSVRCIHD